MLAPLIQASQLLQGRKTESDIDALADMCKDLTYNQVRTSLINLSLYVIDFYFSLNDSMIIINLFLILSDVPILKFQSRTDRNLFCFIFIVKLQ